LPVHSRLLKKTLRDIIVLNAEEAQTSERHDKNVSERGYYLTIWRADARGAWKVLADFQNQTAEKP
jgi:hypothetical protein